MSPSEQLPFGICGTIEGFYGPPWSHAQRRDHLAFSADIGLTTYVYAPKDDPYHRRRWREPYPSAELVRIADLAESATALGVRFVYALHPALSMRFSDDAEHAALAAKAAQLHRAGVGAFALLFDDVPLELADPHDVDRFGSGPAGAGAAHGHASTRFVEEFLAPRDLTEPLLICPTDYAGTDPSPYREALARTAPADALVAWTGADIVVGQVTRADIDRAAASYQRRLVLWDNFPVNDFEPSRLFLGPLTGRPSDLDGAPLAGVLANPMIQAVPSQIPLVTVAGWARDPRGYNAEAAAGKALRRVAGRGAEGLAPFVRVCSTWPPSRDQDPELSAATERALAGESSALDMLEERLGELARVGREAAHPAGLIAALRPWLDGAHATAEAGLAAVGLLRALADDPGAETDTVAGFREQTRAALRRAETHYENVLRPIVPPFVRAVLQRAAPADEVAPPGRPVALLVTERPARPGDWVTAEFLQDEGFAVRWADHDVAAAADGAALAVVTTTIAEAELTALAAVAVPVLAWGGLVPLGLASAAERAMSWDDLTIEAPGDPLAAGLDGVVAPYRGAAWLTVADAGAHAQVVARGPGGRAAVFGYAAGAELVDGTPAPAPRVGIFLGAEGPAPWLLSPAGRGLVHAALRSATGA